MSTTTMHFGPEWMRPKQLAPSRTQPPPSPPPANPSPSGVSSYSALVSSVPTPQSALHDETHPFRYSKEELLKIYKEGGGKGGLGLEVERWEGVVREYGSDPIGLREMNEGEKKLFAGPLNSDRNRRQSTDYFSPLAMANLGQERPRLGHNPSSVGSPLRERYGSGKRRDSNAEPTNSVLPRKQSLSSLQAPAMSPREVGLPSPRTRVGFSSNFDGVLSGGDSWVARRRAAEAQRVGVSPGSTNRGEGEESNDKIAGIKDGTLEQNDGVGSFSNMSATGNDDPADLNVNNDLQSAKDVGSISSGVGQLSLHTSTFDAVDTIQNQTRIGPPGLTDLGSIEWSYKDPTGTVQGPFPAELMQKWFDDGYFSADLPMKRTHLDATWSTVEQLLRRCDTTRIFLTPLQTAPPGLSMHNDSPSQFNQYDPSVNGPYQPAPIRTLRNPLDVYIGTGSNHSESPSSLMFGDSPEPNAFGGMINNQFYNGTPTGSGSGFHTTPEIPSSFTGRRGTHAESPIDPSLGLRMGPFPANISSRTPSMDAFGYSNTFNSVQQSPWGTPSTNTHLSTGYDATGMTHASHDYIRMLNDDTGLGINYNGLRNPQDPAIGLSHISPLNYGPERPIVADERLYNQHSSFSLALGNEQTIAHSFTSNQHFAPQQLPQHAHSLDPAYAQHAAYPTVQNTIPVQQSPWPDISQIDTQRPNPFEDSQPTNVNTVVQSIPTQTQSSPWEQVSQTSSSQPSEGTSPWGVPSPVSADKDFGDVASSSNSDTQVEREVSPVENPPAKTTLVQPSEPSKHQAQATDLTSPAAPTPTSYTSKPSGKQRKQSSQEIITKAPSAPAPTPQRSETPSPSTIANRPVWQKEEEAKKTISLREIQEAEAKKAEARKVAERERERAARAASSSPDKEDIQSFVASWGLPTSQAGTRTTSLPVKDSSSSPTSTTTIPVWTAALKTPVAKKSMKEILEEEEKRKKAANQPTIASAIAGTPTRRLYAETSTKPSAPPALSGGAWTTVGPSGKTSVATVVLAARPPSATTATTPGVTRTTSVPTASSASRPAQPILTKPVSVPAPRMEDTTPSHEFLNWLNDSLKGLNKSVNVEEIMNMLLSFPVDADVPTKEIISDLIYDNSTTMDGRRFADDFASRRKAGAIARGGGPAKPVSIADVVKAAPKTTQQEWGFKVVNKKKKGGRS